MVIGWRRFAEREIPELGKQGIRPCSLSPTQAQIMDNVMALDRTYFEDIPGEKSYVREFISGETAPMPDPSESLLVEVVQKEPGYRIRRFFKPPDGTRN